MLSFPRFGISRLPSLIAATLWFALGHPTSPVAADWVTLRPAVHHVAVKSTPLTAVASAGARIVAVGDHGIILLSDDGGAEFRQANFVPVRAMLTSVSFWDDKVGLATGHDGIVLATGDGGETWTLRYDERGRERPLLAVRMLDADRAISVGLFGQLQLTSDRGKTWTTRVIGKDDDSDRHLYAISRSPSGTLLVFAEAGTIFRSSDGGETWGTTHTGDKGSLWAGLVTEKGTVLASGLRGRLFRSDDDGLNWTRIDSHTTQSLTGLTQLPSGKILAIGYGGAILVSEDDGKTFLPLQPHANSLMTAVAASAAGKPVAVSLAGVVGEVPIQDVKP